MAHASCASVSGIASDPCAASGPPPRPAVSGGGGPDLTLALQNLHFAVDYGSPGVAPSVAGLDLDHGCSKEDGTPTTCVSSPLASPHKDDGKGVDNGLGWLLADNHAQIGGLLSPNTDARVTLILTLKGYSGQMDDDQVEVDAYVTAGVEPVDGAGTPSEPQWNASDRWTLSCETIPVCGTATIITEASDTHAYVAGGVLVSQELSRLPVVTTSQLQQGGGFVAVRVNLNDPVIVAPLVREGTGFGIRGGLLGGRWSTDEMMAAVAAVCIPPEASVGFVCTNADVASLEKLDGTGHACDALSVGMRFDAHPATLADGAIAPIVYDTPCDAGAAGSCP